MGCAAYVFLHEDQRQNEMSPHAKLMTFIGFTDGMKGWKFMRSTNAIFHATQAVFDKSTFLHCPGSWVSILAIEIKVLNIDESNIPLEEFEVPQAPPAVEADPIWLHGGGFPYIPNNIVPGAQLPLGDPPINPPSPSIGYTTPSYRESSSWRSGSKFSGTSSGGLSSGKQVPPSGGSSQFRTPSLRLPRADPDSSYGFFNPNPGPSDDPLYDSKSITHNPDGSPSNIWYNYMRHGRQFSWDWHNLTSMCYHDNATGTDIARCPAEWWRPEGRPDLDNSIFEEFLQRGGQSSQTSPTPASQWQPPVGENIPSQSQSTRPPSSSSEGIPSGPIETAHEGPRRLGRTCQQRQQPDNVYSSMETTQVESLTDRLWERFLGDSQSPQGPPKPQGQFTLGRSDSGYNSHETALWQTSDHKLGLQLIIEEGGDCFQKFLLAAARRTII